MSTSLSDSMKQPWSLPWRPEESTRERRFYFFAALAIIGLVAAIYMLFWVPVHTGVDQNGYLVGGKMFAQGATSKLTPTSPVTGQPDPYLFVGRMWVGADLGLPTERYYPKYPVGLPILIAGALKIGGPAAAHLISPVCSALALLATFLLLRQLVGSFLGIIGLFLVACSPVFLELSINPNSHAADLFFVCWGMYFLFKWMVAGGYRWALGAGFFLGYSVTVRYTDGLLILPILWSILTATQWKRPDSRLQAMAMLAAWAVPVVYLAVFNLYSLQSLTGYDPTNESTGFSWEYFTDNWENMFRQLNAVALFLLFPLGLAGLAFIPWWHHRLGVWLLLWVAPTLLLYTAYYWAPTGSNNTSYLRFFLALLPGLAAAGMIVVAHIRFNHYAVPIHLQGESEKFDPAKLHGADRWRRWGLPLTIGCLAMISGAMGLRNAIAGLNEQYPRELAIRDVTRDLQEKLPADAIIYSRDSQTFHHLQFVTDFHLYSTEYYDAGAIARLPDMKVDDPQGLQPQRRLVMYDKLRGRDQRYLNSRFEKDVLLALDSGKRVFMLTRVNGLIPPARRPKTGWKPFAPQISPWLNTGLFEMNVVTSWCLPRVENPRRRSPRAQRVEMPHLRFDQRMNEWCVVEITRKAPRPALPAPQTADAAPAPAAAAR